MPGIFMIRSIFEFSRKLHSSRVGFERQKTTKIVSLIVLILVTSVFPPATNAKPDTTSATCPEASILTTSTAQTPVTKANYARAETAGVFRDYVRVIAAYNCSGGVGVFKHQKGAMDPKDRTIRRANFDTLYSFAIIDLTNPATVKMPDSGRYQILEVVSDEHWIPFISDQPGTYQFTKEMVGSRYAFILIRTQVNMQDPNDLLEAGDSQEKIELIQSQKGEFIVKEEYDHDEIMKLRAAYNKRREIENVTAEMMFGKKGEISNEMRNFGVAIGWGGLPKEGAVYPMPTVTESTKPQTLTLKDVPMRRGSFWSVTVYNKQGFATGKNYNINSAFARKNDDGEYIINLGGSPDQDNFLDIYPGWNAVIRIYSPTEKYFDSSWTIPQFKPKASS